MQNGFMDRWIFAFPDKVPYPKLKENEIDDSVKESCSRIIERTLSIPYEGKPNVLRFSPEAKAAYSDWFNSLSDQKNCGGDGFAGLATKMDRYCGRFALGLEVLAYGCGESELTEVSLRSVKGAIALCYYFIGCGLKAQREYLSSPAADLPAVQRLIYDEVPRVLRLGRVWRWLRAMGCLSGVSRDGWRLVVSRRSVMDFMRRGSLLGGVGGKSAKNVECARAHIKILRYE